MNKTININLAGTFFHIDEDAYLKLQRYLEAIKRSFTSPQGRDEIIADIEARIAELFAEKMQHDRQVISNKEVDEVIGIMGQPEDYLVDEEIFDDQPKSNTTRKTSKQLFRDTDNKYIGGVCSGLSHYLGIDTLWIRLFFIFFTVFSGFGLIAYILFWILAPEATTTAQKLSMTGEPINISNIERKVKEGMDNIAEKVKNVDYGKVGDKVKATSKGFFEVIGDIILFIFNIFAKFIGILLIIIGASVLIGLFIASLTVGIANVVHVPGVDFVALFNTTGLPIWFISLLLFFAVGVPFFFLFYLGLKILVNNLKSIGNIAKFSLLGLWLASIIGLMTLGIREASEHAYTESVSKTETFYVTPSDTLIVTMRAAENEENRLYKNSTFDIITDDNDVKKIYSEDMLFTIKPSKDSLFYIKIRKDAEGRSYKDARKRAENIEYHYAVENNLVQLDNFLLTPYKNKYRDQEVDVTLYIPAGTLLKLNESTRGSIGRGIKNDKEYYRSKIAKHLWKMGDDGELKCLDCTNEEVNEEDTDSIIIDKEGIDINIKDKEENFEMKIDAEGVKVKKT